MTMEEANPDVIRITLRDGTVAEMRPLVPDDKDRIVEGLNQMSPQSRAARFGTGISGLSAAELRYLTDIDQVSHVAWGATIGGEPAGVGRYIVDDAADAEIAIAVVDRFQRRGLGRALFDALAASARAAGISRFRFEIEPWNRKVLHMLGDVEVSEDGDQGMLIGRISLADIPPGPRDEELVDLLDRDRQRLPGAV
jgi:GNAT superfamily N-acetyltransferase